MDYTTLYLVLETQLCKKGVGYKELRQYCYTNNYRVILHNLFYIEFDTRFNSLKEAVETYNSLGD